jgi:photosystem II stability/assembly factor-like uncharacterized protein
MLAPGGADRVGEGHGGAGAIVRAAGLKCVRVLVALLAWPLLVAARMEPQQVTCVAADPRAPETLYVAQGGRLLESNDGGAEWRRADRGLDGIVTAMAVDPTASRIAYAGTESAGVFKSTDGGRSWRPISAGMKRLRVRVIRIDPATTRTVYAGGEGGLFKSTDGGKSWKIATKGMTRTIVLALLIDPKKPATLYAATYDGGVFVSADAAESWRGVSIGLTYRTTIGLAFDPTASTTLYASTFGGMFESKDAAAHWSALAGAPLAARFLVTDPRFPSTIYAATGEEGTLPPVAGVFKSTDAGATWRHLSAPLQRLSALVLGGKSRSVLFAGAREGLFESTDGGETWAKDRLSGG